MTGRRTILGWLGLVPALSLLSTAAPLLAIGRGEFRPGQMPHRLVRQVTRPLGDNAALLVERAWSVQFFRQDGSFLVVGRQSDVKVVAPPALAFLSQLERDRIEEGMFPILLDQSGAMATVSAGPANGAVAAAVDEVRRRLADLPVRDSSGQDGGYRFLDMLQQAGQTALAAWPGDLFAPGMLDQTDERTIDLPDGAHGVVTVRTLAASDPETGLMQRFERQVKTRIGDDLRVGSEAFSLTPQA